jgi:hypothetical protein
MLLVRRAAPLTRDGDGLGRMRRGVDGAVELVLLASPLPTKDICQ